MDNRAWGHGRLKLNVSNPRKYVCAAANQLWMTKPFRRQRASIELWATKLSNETWGLVQLLFILLLGLTPQNGFSNGNGGSSPALGGCADCSKNSVAADVEIPWSASMMSDSCLSAYKLTVLFRISSWTPSNARRLPFKFNMLRPFRILRFIQIHPRKRTPNVCPGA